MEMGAFDRGLAPREGSWSRGCGINLARISSPGPHNTHLTRASTCNTLPRTVSSHDRGSSLLASSVAPRESRTPDCYEVVPSSLSASSPVPLSVCPAKTSGGIKKPKGQGSQKQWPGEVLTAEQGYSHTPGGSHMGPSKALQRGEEK